MKFEFEISDDYIQTLIKGIVQAEFNPDGFHKGQGYESLKEMIRKHVAKVVATLGPTIEEVIQKMTPGIVEDVCSAVLREKISKLAREMKRRGQLPLFRADGEKQGETP